MKRILTLGIAAGGFLTLAAFPVASQASTPHHYQAQINGRFANQSARIQQGLNSHELNYRQDYRLRAGDTKVRLQEDRDLSRNDGHLTTREDHTLNHELNRDSKAIYRAKH